MSREQMLEQLTALNEACADSFGTEEILYHYTSARGFRGIVASGEIWLTNTAFVNDTMECRAFWDLTREDVFGDGSFPNKHVPERWEHTKQMRTEESIHYIASFSKTPNLLQQFRAYGSFCIGFKASELVRAGFRLYDCVYTPSQVREWIRKKSVIKQWGGDCLDDEAKSAAAWSLVYVASMKYKSIHYEAEKEVRLIAESRHDVTRWPRRLEIYEKEPPIHFRDHLAYEIPVPYVKFFISRERTNDDTPGSEDPRAETAVQMKRRRLKEEERKSREPLPITEVSIGPVLRRDESRLACEILLREKGYEDVPVNVPDIPYRGV